MAKAIGDRFAEALAELIHKKMREAWGFGEQEDLSVEDLIREKYRGIRPAPGYPASPDHSEKRLIWDLLRPDTKFGAHLTESCAINPASSIAGLYFSHPESKYFTVGTVGNDQLDDYAKRKKMKEESVKKWLRPNLDS
jgi:5-methyltetrahydrofolate--homocysteine methyltransferase